MCAIFVRGLPWIELRLLQTGFVSMIGVLLTLLFDEICLPGVTKIVRSTLWVLTNCCYRSRCLDSALTKVCFVSWKLILWQYFIFTFSHHPALTTAHYRERKPSLPVGAHTTTLYFLWCVLTSVVSSFSPLGVPKTDEFSSVQNPEPLEVFPSSDVRFFPPVRYLCPIVND